MSNTVDMEVTNTFAGLDILFLYLCLPPARQCPLCTAKGVLTNSLKGALRTTPKTSVLILSLSTGQAGKFPGP